MKLETKFSLGDKVLIPDLDNANAVVRGISIGIFGATYSVAWFHNGKREECYVFEDEIKLRTNV